MEVAGKKKIFLVAGEASGDVLGGDLMRSLKDEYGADNLELYGVGGKSMAEQGLDSLIPMEELCVMGITEVIEHLPRLRKLIGWVAAQIERIDPDIVVFIDLPDFNFRVAKLLKRRGDVRAKLVHYVAPTVWAWRPGRAKYISKFLDGLMCLFPFEPEYFEIHDLRSEFVGHPVARRNWLDETDKVKVIDKFKKSRQVSDNAKLIGVMFGSRISEFKRHAPIFYDALSILKEQHSNLELVVPTLPHLQFEVMELLSHLQIPAYIITDQDEKWDALACVDGALAVSGTMGLELAYADVPHIVAYKTSWFNAFLIRHLASIKFVHLANIILDKAVVPEFLQENCTADKLAGGLLRLIQVPQLVQQQKSGFQHLRKKLGGDDEAAGRRAAQFVLSYLK